MHVLFDCRSIVPSHSRGIENFAYAVARAVAEVCDSVALDVCAADLPAYRALFADVPAIRFVSDPIQGRFAMWVRASGMRGRLARMLRRLGCALGWDALGRRGGWSVKQKADVVFYPYHRDSPQYPHIPSVVTIHAVLPEYGPYEMQTIAQHVERAAAIVVSWPFPLEDIGSRFPNARERMFMVPFTVMQNVVQSTGFAFKGHEVPEKYYLYPAAILPRKNHTNLIKGYGEAARMGVRLPPVVCTGGGDGALLKELKSLASSLKVSERFLFLDYVPKEAMAALYSGCSGTVSASLWEAGIATIQEGGYLGKPAACADTPPARLHAGMLGMEVCFFDPLDPTDIASKLIEFTENLERYSARALQAAAVVRQYDARYLGQRYLEVFAWAAGRAQKPIWAPFLDPQRALATGDDPSSPGPMPHAPDSDASATLGSHLPIY